MDVRTKPTIDECIQHIEKRGSVTFVLYVPGNGTQYHLIFTWLGELSSSSRAMLGMGESEGWQVSLVTEKPRPSMFVIAKDGLLHWTYVLEKLGGGTARLITESDARVLAEIIGTITGREFVPAHVLDPHD